MPSRWENLYPSVENEDGAKLASQYGLYGAMLVGSLTGAAAIYALITGDSFMGIDGWGLIDGVIWWLLAWRIWRYSRIAAAFGLAYYLLGRWNAYSSGERFWSGAWWSVILTISFLNSVRGTFALRRLNRKSTAQRAM